MWGRIGLAGALLLLLSGCSKPSATDAQRPAAGTTEPTPQSSASTGSQTDVTASESDPFTKPPKPDDPPVIVVILVDTLRADRVGVYGNPRGLTETMDRWARDGVVFENAIAPAPWTLPSVASLFTGFYQPVHGANASRYTRPAGKKGGNWRRGIPDQLPTFIESLADTGYMAYGISANLFVQKKTGFARGFAAFQNRAPRNRRAAAKLNRDVSDILNRVANMPKLLLYVHYMDVHEPYLANPKYIDPLLDEIPAADQLTRVDDLERGIFREAKRQFADETRHTRLMPYVEYWQARYDGGVMELDQALGTLEHLLKKTKLWERSWLILLSDHGEALGEDDTWSHGNDARQHQLHVPLIMRWPGYLPAGKRVAAPVSLVDVFPTLLDALNIRHGQKIQGRSLLPLIFDAEETSPPVFAAGVKRRPNEFAIVAGRWKLRFDPDNELVELYDLKADPLEAQNLARENEAKLLALQALLEKHQAENAVLAKTIKQETSSFSQSELKMLNALGYLGEDEDDEDPYTSMDEMDNPMSQYETDDANDPNE